METLCLYVEFAETILLKQLRMTVVLTFPILLVIVAFIAFVVHNKGIVVGDKSNHTPAIHPAMLLHLALLLGGLLAPVAITQLFLRIKQSGIVSESKKLLSDLPLHLLGIATTAAVLNYGVVAHPFLLSDNR